MNILLVDDSIDVLQGIEAGIDFASLGIENVYLAQNIQQAKDILNKVQIDIILADIEMPQGSGLDLLQWVRDNHSNIVALFCTCYADFNYAQKAVELHSFDYYLKPISYDELSSRLAKAVEEVKRNNVLKSYQKYGQYWLDNLKNNKDRFWSYILYDFDLPSEAEMLKVAADHKLFYEPKDRFTLCILDLSNEEEVLQKWSKSMFEYGFKNIAGELFTTSQTAVEGILRHQENVWSMILKQESETFDIALFLNCCKQLVESCNKYLQSSVNCYYVNDCGFGTIPAMFRKLEEIFEDDVSSVNQIYDLKKYKKKDIRYQLTSIREWEELLSNGKPNELLRETFYYLDNLALKNELNMKILKSFRIDMMQMIHTVLKNRQIEAHRLFGNETFDRLRERSLKSVQDMKKYIKYIVDTAASYINLVEQSQSVVGKVMDYIDSHLDEEITRASLAKIVYLNSDYLARLFKRNTGESLGSYLLDKRIDKAKYLLLKTDLPVNVISLKVGYDNFSYFSRLFRKKTGYTPNEYRKAKHT